jgi:alkylation response protein AidB-like acyl-CoA dehydrogenase
LKTPEDNGIQWEEEHKLGIRASSTRQVFFNETKVLLKTCYLKRNGFKIAMNALNVGRIKLAACLDAQRRVITNATALCKRKSTI